MELSKSTIVVGCNYHTTWQSHRSMRFVLKEVKDSKARLITRGSGKDFWTDIESLIFIMSAHNMRKAKDILKKNYNFE